MGAKESGTAFIAGVLAKLPETDRAAAQALFAKPEAEAAVALIGDGVLARAEFSKQMDDLTKQRTEIDERKATLNDWWAQNKAALEEYLVIKPEYDTLKADPTRKSTSTPLVTGLTKDEIAAELERRDRGFAGALALGMNLAARHLHMFNEPLDMSELLADPKLGRPLDGQPGRVYGLQDAYDSKHGERVRTKHTEAETARIDKLVKEKLDEERRKLPQPMPFPLRDPSPSPLDVLTATDRKPGDYTVDSAVAEYDRLSQQRQQTGA